MFAESPFPNTAGGEYSLVSTRARNYSVDFRTVIIHKSLLDFFLPTALQTEDR